MANPYARFFLSIGLAAIFILIASFIFTKGDRLYHIHKNNKTAELFSNSTPYDVMFIGSSRTHSGIYPKVADSISGLSSFNAGADGANMVEFYYIFKGYIVNHPAPDYLVLTIDPVALTLDTKIAYPMQYFGSLNNPAIREMIRTCSKYSTYLLERTPWLKAVYFDDYVKSLAISGLLGRNELGYAGHFEDKGFWTRGAACLDSTKVRPYTVHKSEISPECMQYFDQLINLAQTRGSRVMVCYSPEYKKGYQKSVSDFADYDKKITGFLRGKNIEIIRDDNLDPFCEQKCNFSDVIHLNTIGAINYSQIWGHRLQKIALNKQ